MINWYVASFVKYITIFITEYLYITLKQAIQFGGTTLSDHTQVDGSKGRLQSQLMIYGRAKKSYMPFYRL